MTVKYLFRCKSNVITSTFLKYRLLNVHRCPSPSVLVRPYSRRIKKDSDFKHTGECESYDYTPEDLNSKLTDKVREVKTEGKLTRKRVIKKSLAKRVKEPKMLTYCDELHIKSLHNSSPDEWTPKTLSECFPALPHMIKNILKSKLKPKSVEMVKEINKIALANWEKLRKNELECSPKYRIHLKEFINRSDVIKLQMSNPNFSYLPQNNNIPEDKTGVFTSLIEKYEKSLNVVTEKMVKFHLKNNFSKKCSSLEGGVNTSDLTVGNNIGYDQSLKEGDNATDLVVKNDITNDLSLKGDNTTILKRIIQQKGYIPEYSRSTGKWKLLTLDELKESVFRKAEKHSLTDIDKQIIERALTKHHLTPFRTRTEVAVNSEYVKSQTNEEAPTELIQTERRSSYEHMEETEHVSSHQMKSEDEEFVCEGEVPDHLNLFQPVQINDISSAKKSNEFSEKEKVVGDSQQGRGMSEIREKAPSELIKTKPRNSYDNVEETENVLRHQMKSEDEEFVCEGEVPDHLNLFQPVQINNISSAKKSNEFSEKEKVVGDSQQGRGMSEIREKAPSESIKTKPRNSYDNVEETENVLRHQTKSEDEEFVCEGEVPDHLNLFQPVQINDISSAKKSNEFSEKEKVVGDSQQGRGMSEIREKAPPESIKTKPRNSYDNVEETENVLRHQTKSEDKFICEEEISDYPNLFPSSQLNNILNRTQSNESPEEEKTVGVPKKTKVPVRYYGTEKDKEVYAKLEEEISKTCFWDSGEKNQLFYNSSSVNTHLDDSFISYQSKYSYPKKIKIPNGIVEKNKLYKLNDCYYDHKGHFLYRVPGMT